MHPKPIRLSIAVDGKSIQSIYSSQPVEVVILDFDAASEKLSYICGSGDEQQYAEIIKPVVESIPFEYRLV